MTENNIKLVNKDGMIVGKNPKTGETVPIELGETITESLSTDEITNVYDYIVSESDNLQAIFENDVSTGDSVFVESGTHSISAEAPVPSDVLVDGAGYSSVIQPTGNIADLLTLEGSNSIIRNLRFNDPGNGADDRKTQGITSVAGAETTNTLITDCFATGRVNFIQGQGWQNCSIVNNIVNTTNPANLADPNLEGVALPESSNQTPQSNTISNNSFRFDENGNAATDTAAIELDGRGETTTISGNAVRGFPNGVQLDNGPNAPDGNAVIGNTFDQIPQTAIQLRGPQTDSDGGGTYNTVVGNLIKTGGTAGIVVNSRCTVLSGNVIVGPTTGIRVAEFEAPATDGNVVNVQANYLEANTTAIDVQSGTENYLIGNNYINNATTGIATAPGDGYIHGNYVQSTATPYSLATGERRADNEPPAITQTVVEADRTSSVSITTNEYVNIIDTVNTDEAGEINRSNQFVPEETGYYFIAGFAGFNNGGSGDTCAIRIRDINAEAIVGVQVQYGINAANFEILDTTTVEKLTAGVPYEIQAANRTNGGSVTAQSKVRIHRFG